jgi:hypothetical protein
LATAFGMSACVHHLKSDPVGTHGGRGGPCYQ